MANAKLLSILFLLILPLTTMAHEEENEVARLSENFAPIDAVLLTTAIIVLALLASFAFRHKHKHAKKVLFLLIAIPTITTSIYLAADTIHLNLISDTGGPVHWHADFQLWACGERISMQGPESAFDNKVGTPVFHHHDDDRIHVEGVLVSKSDAELHSFFETIGGTLTDELVEIKDRSGNLVSYRNGDLCSDGNPGVLKFYVNGKLDSNKSDHILAPYEVVPPGDCIIIDFSPGEEGTTEKVCESVEAKGGYSAYESGIGGL